MVIRRAREADESKCCSQELAALVEHAAMLHQRPGQDEHRGGACTLADGWTPTPRVLKDPSGPKGK